MKSLSKALFVSGLIAAAGMTNSADAAGSCTTCGGYFYTAISYVNNNGITNHQYMSVGPFADQDSCWQAVNNDYGNNDNWLPFEGSPKCVWRYETNYEVYDDIIDDWNTVSNPSNPGVIADKEVIAKIAELRKSYRVKEYEESIHTLISPITDPNNDPDEDAPAKR